jgi:predicted PurR-regulated permease PerM
MLSRIATRSLICIRRELRSRAHIGFDLKLVRHCHADRSSSGATHVDGGTNPRPAAPIRMDMTLAGLGLGAVVGLILALTGAGGGILAVPLLVFGLHLSIAQAAPVGLIAVGAASAFGALLVDQIIEIVESVPLLAAQGLEWFNQTFGQSYTAEELLAQVNLDQEALKQIAADAAKGIFGFAVSLIGGIFGLFTFALIAFYLSADGPRLRRYIASMLPTQSQSVFLNVWDITADKTGRYVAARAILAAVNSFCSGVVFAIIGLPYWLPLALWTGIVAQFVPTIGTYISIILPVIVGLLSGNPWLGVIVLVYALIYQQIENLTIEPRISAKAVDVHPAYGFVAVLLGAALFGVAGALLAVPASTLSAPSVRRPPSP